MALLPVNSDDPCEPGRVFRALAALPERAPVVILIHGFKFSPRETLSDPHRHILSLTPRRDCWKAVSWPRHLGLGGDAGLAIGFGWHARGSIWEAWEESARAGAKLAALVALIRRLDPTRPVHLLGHSLGARVALRALPDLAAGDIGRIVLISPAQFRSEAARLVDTPAGRRAEIFNVTGQENMLFDLLLRLARPLDGATIGGGGPNHAGWLDLELDRPGTLSALAGMGHRIRPASARVCHWSGYLRPGIWPFYRALLLAPQRTPLAVLRTALAPADRARTTPAPAFAAGPVR